ncbi:MAG: ABC transporter permease subunit [Verrucomicrobiota bacterium]
MNWIQLLFTFLVPVAVIGGVGYFLLWHVLAPGVRITFQRELGSYFYSPVAYVCLGVFAALSSTLSFALGQFIEQGDASLTRSFFVYHPWIFAVVAPAIGMRLWSEEHRQGTIELLTTMPIAIWHAIVGKFLAAAVVIFAALLATVPALITLEVLGNPDLGPALSGYLASFLMACSCLAITSAISAFTRSQVTAFLLAVFISVILIFIGFPPVAHLAGKALPGFDDFLTDLGIWDHFMEMNKGILRAGDLVYFLSIISFCLFTTAFVLRTRRA